MVINKRLDLTKDCIWLLTDFVLIKIVDSTYKSIKFDAEKKPQQHHVINENI